MSSSSVFEAHSEEAGLLLSEDVTPRSDSGSSRRTQVAVPALTAVAVVAMLVAAAQHRRPEEAHNLARAAVAGLEGVVELKEIAPPPIVGVEEASHTASEVFDCDAGYSNWQEGWSQYKKNWCCANKKMGCDAAASSTAPAATSKAPSEPFDCHAGYSNWAAGWSDDKKLWCCKNKQMGCTPATLPVSEPFDCSAGYSNWEAGWSAEKKQWCCANKKMGCESTSAPFDCMAGYSNWQAGWSADKKQWCCQNRAMGCQGAATLPAGGAAALPAPAPSPRVPLGTKCSCTDGGSGMYGKCKGGIYGCCSESARKCDAGGAAFAPAPAASQASVVAPMAAAAPVYNQGGGGFTPKGKCTCSRGEPGAYGKCKGGAMGCCGRTGERCDA